MKKSTTNGHAVQGTKEMGAPTKYTEDHIEEIERYLEACRDEDLQIVKQRNEEKGYESYDNRLVVKLPTVEGFARHIGVNKTSLYEWAKLYPNFSNALERIVDEQKERLINCGLAGTYQPVIVKLMLSSNHGMREKSDVTTDGEKLPTPIYGGNSTQVQGHDSD